MFNKPFWIVQEALLTKKIFWQQDSIPYKAEKEERGLVLMTQQKKLLQKLRVDVPNKYIKTLFQEDLNKESFRAEKQPYIEEKLIVGKQKFVIPTGKKGWSFDKQ